MKLGFLGVGCTLPTGQLVWASHEQGQGGVFGVIQSVLIKQTFQNHYTETTIRILLSGKPVGTPRPWSILILRSLPDLISQMRPFVSWNIPLQHWYTDFACISIISSCHSVVHYICMVGAWNKVPVAPFTNIGPVNVDGPIPLSQTMCTSNCRGNFTQPHHLRSPQ
jgi:hypothetical protein